MAVSATVQPGIILQDGQTVTVSDLNKLGTPTVSIDGAVGTLSLTDGSVTNAKVAASAGVQFDKLESLSTGQVMVGNAGTPTAVTLSGDATVDENGSLTIAAGAIESGMIANDAVVTAGIQDGAVTASKLATGVNIIPTGSLTAFAGGTAPTGWLICDGAEVSRTTYSDLFAVLGENYGAGDSSTTFNLPDMRGRVPVGVDGGAARLSSNDTLGSAAGTETHTLTESEMPSHSHTASINDSSGSGGSGVNTVDYGESSSSPGTSTSHVTVSSTGSDQAHNNMQPYQVVNWIIRT